MLSSLRCRPMLLQHRQPTPRACWLWGSDDRGSQAAAPVAATAPKPPSAPPAAAATPQRAARPAVVMRAVSGQQPPPPPPAAAAGGEQLVPLQQVASVTVVPPPGPKLQLNRSLFDVMKFNGPGPELIQGRLAMLAMVTVPRAELDSGATVLQQAAGTPAWVWAALGLVVYASLIPMLKGARHEAFGIFTPQAEVLNARAAMLGFGILVALEYKAGVPFF